MSTNLPQNINDNIRPFTARGAVRPYRFVKDDSTDDYSVVEADAGDAIVGIYMGFDDLASGDKCPTKTSGQAKLKAGTGGWSKGEFIKSDADGQGIPVTADLDVYGAVALEDAAAGEVSVVQVERGVYGTA
jgi:hypothetical protein